MYRLRFFCKFEIKYFEQRLNVPNDLSSIDRNLIDKWKRKEKSIFNDENKTIRVKNSSKFPALLRLKNNGREIFARSWNHLGF